MEPIKKHSWVLRWALVLAIVIVVNLFFAYAIAVFYDEPEYTDFCEDKQVRIIPETKDECITVGGQWTEDRYIQKSLPRNDVIGVPVIETEQKGYCDPDFSCRSAYEDSRDLYERNVFVVLVTLGVLLLVIGIFLKGVEVVSLGLSFGGILTLIIGSIRYWSNMDDYLRVVVLGIALVALLWVAIKKFKD